MIGLFRAAAVTAGCVGGIGTAVYRLMVEQSRQARRTIGSPTTKPLRADGVYLPTGAGPLGSSAVDGELRLAVLGDSSAAGLGAESPDRLPAVVVARGLARRADRPVRLDTYAVSGSTSRQLDDQVELALVGRPDIVLVLIGANDVTSLTPPQTAATLLGGAVRRLREAGAEVVVGTCPDLGVVKPIQQPLRGLVRTWSLTLARLQRAAVQQAGGAVVPLADLLAADFATRADYFSDDQFHPSGLGYAAAAAVLLPALCTTLGLTGGQIGAARFPAGRGAAALVAA